MQIDLNTPIRDEEGTILEIEAGTPMTLKEVLKVALKSVIKGDEEDTDAQRLWKWDMVEKIQKAEDGNIELKPEDVTKLKSRVLKVYLSPIVYGNVDRLLDSE